MSQYEGVLQKFYKNTVGEVIITDTNWRILYATGKLDFAFIRWDKWCHLYKDDPTIDLDMEWEIADKDDDLYYKVHSKEIIDEGVHYLVHQIVDVSDYAGIFQELSSYSRGWKILSLCQRDLINVLADDLPEILPIVVNNLEAKCAVMYVARPDRMSSYSYTYGDGKVEKQNFTHKVFEHINIPGRNFDIPGFEGEFMCFTIGQTIAGDEYGLYIQVPEDIRNDKMYSMYFNIFKLFIENSLLRERIIYDNEHDHLTGLYNKAKYSELTNRKFLTSDVITVFNLDVNYLKRVNDTYGHEAGNKLLHMAAESLKAVRDDDVYPFRLGGDEFMLVAIDCDEERAKDIEVRWRAALQAINEKEDLFKCIIACGIVTRHKPYDFREMLEESDKLMYADKRAIKIANGDDPDAR